MNISQCYPFSFLFFPSPTNARCVGTAVSRPSPQGVGCCVRACACAIASAARGATSRKDWGGGQVGWCPTTYLAGGVDDLGRIVLALEPDDLAEGVLYRGVVAFDEVAIDELNGERRFAYMVESSRHPPRQGQRLS